MMAFIATVSRADPSQNALISRETSKTNAFPAEPDGTQKIFPVADPGGGGGDAPPPVPAKKKKKEEEEKEKQIGPGIRQVRPPQNDV